MKFSSKCRIFEEYIILIFYKIHALVNSSVKKIAENKENLLKFVVKAVLRIRDVYPGSTFYPSQIRIFSIPDPHRRI